MVIDGGYYISERTSNEKPYAHIDSGTLYLPFDVGDNEAEEGGYAFKEYRITIPIKENIAADVLKEIVTAIPDVLGIVNDTLQNILGDGADIKKEYIYKKVLENTPQIINSAELTDDESLKVTELHPTWENLCAVGYTAEKSGYKFQYDGKLYKTRQENFTFQSQWIPGEGTESLYTHINEEHAGTIEDPIPAIANMEYEYGKYYSEGETIYICKRGGVSNPEEMYGQKVTLQYLPSALIGQYFEVVK